MKIFAITLAMKDLLNQNQMTGIKAKLISSSRQRSIVLLISMVTFKDFHQQFIEKLGRYS